jgi:hypothetical protein
METLKQMFTLHPFWGLLMLSVICWYCTITLYVSVRGAFDIRTMLRELKHRSDR